MSRINFSKGESIYIDSPFEDAVDLLGQAIESDQSGSTVGRAWELACAFVVSGADWPGWEQYHLKLRSEYQKLLPDGVEHRAGVYSTEKDKKDAMWRHHDIAQGMMKNHYIPEGVMLPSFIEAEPAQPSVMRSFAEDCGLPQEVIKEWYLRSFGGCQITVGANVNYSEDAWHYLVDSPAITFGEDMPPGELAKNLNMTQIRGIMKKLGSPMAKTLSQSRMQLQEDIAAGDDRLIDAVRSFSADENLYMVMPPGSLDWDDFQSWRQQIKGMAEAVTDIYLGQIRRKYGSVHDLLVE